MSDHEPTFEALKQERDCYKAALIECETEIDHYIDQTTPADWHPKYARDNAWLKKTNTARVALDEYRQPTTSNNQDSETD